MPRPAGYPLFDAPTLSQARYTPAGGRAKDGMPELGSTYLEKRRQELLDVAERLFDERGLRGLSIPEIAAAAGEAGHAVRAVFGNVEVLLQGVVDRQLDRVIERLHLCTPADGAPGSAVAALAEAVAILIETLAGKGAAARVQLSATLGGGPNLARAGRLRQRYVAHFFAGLIAAARPPDEADLAMPLAMSLLGMCCWHVLWFRPLGALTRADYAAMVTTMALVPLHSVETALQA